MHKTKCMQSVEHISTWEVFSSICPYIWIDKDRWKTNSKLDWLLLKPAKITDYNVHESK